jgi:UDP-N-acetyl-D-mannosaminuronate dehydrogenase
MRVSVIGLGKRGVALTYRIHQAGFEVQGSEISTSFGNSKDNSPGPNYVSTRESDIIIMGAPSSKGTCFLYQIIDNIVIKPGALLAIETTVLPGTCDRICEHLVSRGLIVGAQYHLVYVPYRHENTDKPKDAAPRVIGGITSECLTKGMDFYSRFVEQLFPVTDIRLAEVVPIIESAHRFLHLSFSQEIKEYCQSNQMDFRMLRAAVNVAGHALPEVGAGIGEDLPRDMAFLQGFCPSPLFEGALAADTRYRGNLFDRAQDGQHILVIGLTNTAELDLVSNPTIQLIRDLERRGCTVYVQDENISPLELAMFGLRPPNPKVKYDVIINQGEIYRAWED